MIRTLAIAVGIIIIVVVLWDAFETVVLPRRVSRRIRLTRMFFRATWSPYSAIIGRIEQPKRRESLLGFFGPVSLLLLLSVWVVGMIIGFALVQWGTETVLNAPDETVTFNTYLYMSGVTFLTLGFGDVTPTQTFGRFITVIEAGVGFGSLAIIIGYLPVMYQSFSRREVNIALLDARAGSPPTAGELLRRHAVGGNTTALDTLLAEWERWSAELLESHLSYPVLSFFRSQHTNQSWLAALVVMLDTSALILTGVRGVPLWQARLTFAMARHACADLAQMYRVEPHKTNDRLPPQERARLRETLSGAGIPLNDGANADRELDELRAMYEPYVCAISELFLLPLPSWNSPHTEQDDWQTNKHGMPEISTGTEATALVSTE